MAISHSKQSAQKLAVGYLRRSTSRQEKSLPDQKAEVERYANQHGYQILRWYQDDGISGDATERRQGFLAMHKAACNTKEFSTILVWDSDRFGRFNSIEAGYWIHPLMKAGVHLESVAEGRIEWDDFSGRIVHAVKQEGKHQYLVDLSRNVSRGLASRASKGQLCGQAAPYGFDRMLLDEQGQHRQRVRTGEKIPKPRGWTTTLVASDDPQKLKTLRWIFETFASTDIGMRSMADKLNSQEIPGPSGSQWYAASIKAILENHNYTGTFTFGKRREGKYHRITGGEIMSRDQAEVRLSPAGKPLAIDNPKEAWIVVENAHESLIDCMLFERVQEKIKRRARANPGIGYATHTKANGNVYQLSGLVHCGQCGCKMHGSATIAKGNRYEKYLCSNYARSGKNNPSGCGCHAVQQNQLVRVIANKLKTMVAGNLDRLKAAIRKQLSERQSQDSGQVDELKKSIAGLTKEIDQAATNFLRAPADLLDIIAGKLSAMRRQKEQLEEQLKQAEQAESMPDIDAKAKEITDRIWQLEQELLTAEPDRQRELFRLFIDRIDLHFGRLQRGKRQECPLVRGEIVLQTGENSIFGSVSRRGESFTQPKITFTAAEFAAA